MNKKRGKNRKAQVWIETIIYTLIAFILIGLVLSFARPKIEEMQDNALLKQSTEMMKQIDLTILGMTGAGNQRVIEITIKKGKLNLDCPSDQMVFVLESKGVYSEPGVNISDGNIIVRTEEKTDSNTVTLTRDYSSKYNLRYKGDEIKKAIEPASNSYKLTILNAGDDTDGRTILEISLD